MTCFETITLCSIVQHFTVFLVSFLTSSFRLISLLPVILGEEDENERVQKTVYLECEDDEFALALLNGLVQSSWLLNMVIDGKLKFVCRFKLGYSFWVDHNFMVQVEVTTIFGEDTCILTQNRLTSFIVLCLLYTNKFGPSLSLLGENFIKIKAFEDIIEKWPEKVFINSSLNIDNEIKQNL